MSGHSKWATIKHKKAALDAKRGKVFTRLIKEIVIAARSGGDPDSNARLRTAIVAAKAVMRGTGELEGGQIDEIMFEGYGPGGAAILVSTATDNRNRTVSEMRHMFSKNGGNLGELGSVAWMFDRKSQVVIEKEKAGEEQMMNFALEVGADDVKDADDTWVVLSPPELHTQVLEALEKAGITTVSADIAMIPKTPMEIENKNVSGMMRILDLLEEHDDVQNVYTNVEFSEEQMAAAEK
jgi:YebC/PmpR family DNA-binding regulatory protein